MRQWHLGLALFALCIWARAATADTPSTSGPIDPGFVAALDACIERLPSASEIDGDETVYDIRSECGALATRLARIEKGDWRAGVDPSEVGVAELEDLRAFADELEYRTPEIPRHSLRKSDLHAILADINVAEDSELGWWEMFLAWMREVFRSQDPEDTKRLFDWLEKIRMPDWVAGFVFDATIVLILVIAIAVVGNELRLLGAFRRRDTWTERRRARALDESSAERAPETLESLEGLPVKAHAAAVLSLVIRTLAGLGLVSPATSYTNRELLYQLSDSALAERFRGLVSAVEPIIYGDGEPPAHGRAGLLDTARSVLATADQTADESRVLHG